MRLIFATISLLFFALDAAAQFSRETTFDGRAACESVNKGIWREFGDVCTDGCESKFDKFKICDRIIQSSCDCGAGRCWEGEKCVLMSKYKKTYETNLKEEKIILEKAKKKRKAEAKANAEMITEKLVKGTAMRAVSFNSEGATNNYTDFYGNIVTEVGAKVIAGAADVGRKMQQGSNSSNELPSIPLAPPIDFGGGNSEVPPAFLAQEKFNKLQEESSLGALPLIPLP
jgi:hypothetical protein